VEDILKGWQAGVAEAGMDSWCSALRQWCDRYSGDEGQCRWMLVPLLWFASQPRRLALELDRADSANKYQAKVVEVLREQFQKLHRDRTKREGSLAICCELLRLYFHIGQAAQCSFLLAAVSQTQGGQKLDMKVLPKSISVTLCYFWGKHCVLDGNVAEAEDKLGFALSCCPPKASRNRQKILTYLVPCRLRKGRFPSRALLKRHGLQHYNGIVRSVVTGNVRLFESEFEEYGARFIQAGTYLIVEKLKLLVFQTLCRQVYAVQASEIESRGKAEHRHKQDLMPYETAFKWQDDCDEDETMCVMANLIYIGAVRGYMSDEHHKIVFSKESAFPPSASWSSKA